MGRYDGEDYEIVPACSPTDHSFMFNGICHRCRRSKNALISDALILLETLRPKTLCARCQKEISYSSKELPAAFTNAAEESVCHSCFVNPTKRSSVSTRSPYEPRGIKELVKRHRKVL